MRAQQSHAERLAAMPLSQQLCSDDATSSLRPYRRSRCAPSSERAPRHRARNGFARSRFRGAEDEVETATVSRRGEEPDHRRAFDMPAGAPSAPRRIPSRSRPPGWASTARSRRGRACTGRPRLGPRDHCLTVPSRQLPIIGIAGHRKQHMAPRHCRVRSDARSSRPSPDFLGRVRSDFRRVHAERAHVL